MVFSLKVEVSEVKLIQTLRANTIQNLENEVEDFLSFINTVTTLTSNSPKDMQLNSSDRF